MKLYGYGLIFCCVFVFLGKAVAQEVSEPAVLALAADPTWLRLGHYDHPTLASSGWRSQIHSPEFFLDPQGALDPVRELQATLKAFSAAPSAVPDQDPRCRFPARWLWLRSRLADASGATLRDAAIRLVPIECPAYRQWTREHDVISVSVVFATGFLGNPASYYGHTLLKLNFRGDAGRSGLLDQSVNYGAILTGHDDPVTYLAKSLAGGYDGGFSNVQFYYLDHNYGENELRDLWDYQLELPADAVELIVAHAWEVLGKRFTYYFFRRNCAFHMAELIEVVEGLDITPAEWPWIVPQAMMEKLGRARFNGKPLVRKITYLPSRQSRFYGKYLALTLSQQNAMEAIVAGGASLDAPAFAGMSQQDQRAVIDALLDYYQFIAIPFDRAERPVRAAYVSALAARFRLDPEAAAEPVEAPAPQSPDLGRPPAWFQVGGLHNSASGNFLAVRLRPAYYDALDAGPGAVRNAHLVMGDTQLSVRAGGISLNRLDLIGVESVNPGISGLPGDSTSAWKVHVGAEQRHLSCTNCVLARLQGDAGFGRQWTPQVFTAAYLGGAVQGGRDEGSSGFVRASGDLIVRPSDTWGASLAYEQRLPLARRTGSYGVARAEARWTLDHNRDLRLSAQHDGARVLGIGFGAYW